MSQPLDLKEASHRNTVGSTWRRWDPHLHVPGTLKNDQFKGEDLWTQYRERLDSLDTPIEALGITDYCSIRSYIRAVEELSDSLTPRFIFPNVEFRLGIQTTRGNWINLHLVFDPKPNDHVSEIQRILSSLEFKFRSDLFRCNDEDLIRLGRAVRDEPSLPDEAALKEGANQFKVDFSKLRELKSNRWFAKHCLIAVAVGSDGTSGLQTPDGTWAAQ